MGNVQRLPNGNTLIDWGYVPGTWTPDITEIDSNENIVWEMRFTDSTDDVTYRAHRYEWNPCARPSSGLMSVSDITFTTATLHWSPANGATQYLVEYRAVGNEIWEGLFTNEAED